jgi:hypothetical protein
MNENSALRNVERRIVQRACPTLLECPNNDEALDLCEVVEGEDKTDCEGAEGIERLVGASKTLLAKLVGAACDVPVKLSGSAVIDIGARNIWDQHTSKYAADCLRMRNNTLYDTTRIVWHHR